MTNGDKIRQMSNEELAKAIRWKCDCCKEKDTCGDDERDYCDTLCLAGIKAYLDMEAE